MHRICHRTTRERFRIAPKTVQKHLASDYRKLEITSRVKLGSHFAVYAKLQSNVPAPQRS
jgi:hypothetical protein